jgi:hypothetical protein
MHCNWRPPWVRHQAQVTFEAAVAALSAAVTDAARRHDLSESGVLRWEVPLPRGPTALQWLRVIVLFGVWRFEAVEAVKVVGVTGYSSSMLDACASGFCVGQTGRLGSWVLCQTNRQAGSCRWFCVRQTHTGLGARGPLRREPLQCGWLYAATLTCM